MNLHQLNLDSDQRQRLAALLEKHEQLHALREQLLSTDESPQDRALRVVSIVRAFDRAMYEDVCRRNEPDLPQFDEFIKNPDVQSVPRAEGKFWVRDSVQNYWLDYWNKHDDDYLRWAGRFADWLEQHGEDPAVRLALLMRVDPGRALELLRTTFEKANDEDNLILCDSLTQQIDANLARIEEPRLRLEFSTLAARYRGRAR